MKRSGEGLKIWGDVMVPNVVTVLGIALISGAFYILIDFYGFKVNSKIFAIFEVSSRGFKVIAK